MQSRCSAMPAVLAVAAAALVLPVHAAAEVPGSDRPSVDLSGPWEFRMDPKDVGKAESWYAPGAAFEREITVPGAWNAQSAGRSARPGEAPSVFDLNGPADDAHSVFHSYRGVEGFGKLFPQAKELTARPEAADCDLLVTTHCDEATLAYLEQGGRVLLLDPEGLFKTQKVLSFRPVCWDPAQQGAHVGTAVRNDHPALKKVPCEGWCDLEFHPLVMGAKLAVLDDVPARIDPIVRTIDMPQRLSNRALLFEIRVGKGPLMVSGLNFPGALKNNDPAATYVLDQLVRYGLSGEFAPKAEVPKLPIQPRGQ